MGAKLLTNWISRALILLSLLASLVVFMANSTDTKTRISNIVFDNYLLLSPRESTNQVIFADIDDLSLSKIGQWPWPRNKIAELVKNIAASGAAVIVFDGVIAEPDRTSPSSISKMLAPDHPAQEALKSMPDNDAVLAQTIRGVGNFVAGFTYGSNIVLPQVKSSVLMRRKQMPLITSQKNTGMYFNSVARFLPELENAAAGYGSFMAYPDLDSVIRQTGLIFHDGHKIYPSLILEALRIYDKAKTPAKVILTKDYSEFKINQPFEIDISKYKIPVSTAGRIWVHYRDLRDDESISIYHFLDSYYNPANYDLKGKAVFIASSAEGLKDLRSTPFGFKPGVEVHMNAFEQVLQDHYLIRPLVADNLEILGAALICLLIILASFFMGPIWLALISASLSAGAFWFSWYIFQTWGGLIDPVTPALMIVIIFIASSVISYVKTEMERRQVSTAFGHYISPDFMEELTKDPDKLKLGGEIRDLSILFSDIRSFTTISEGLTPEELIQLMNDFLTPMSDLVMKNKGTIDKYMGDAMMAFWNAPLDDPDHARHACIAALGMQKALTPINEEVRKRAEKNGKKPVLLKAGIGINTGPCAVGNMGSKQRFAYSTLGDAVNLASRLEGQTKNYGTGILIGHETQKQVPEFATLEFDLIQVKGKTKPEHVYGLLGDEEYASTKEFRAISKLHEEMIKSYRQQQWKDMKELLTECKKQGGEDLEFLYNLYKQRLKEMQQNPPGDDWNGVFVATSK